MQSCFNGIDADKSGDITEHLELINRKLTGKGRKLQKTDPTWHRKGALPFCRNAMAHSMGSWMVLDGEEGAGELRREAREAEEEKKRRRKDRRCGAVRVMESE